jgi:hypothetical protein
LVCGDVGAVEVEVGNGGEPNEQGDGRSEALDSRSEAGEARDGHGDQRAPSIFDPVVGVRALADVQRRGLFAAGELVDRLVRLVDGDAGANVKRADGARDSVDGSASARTARPPASVDEVVELWLELVRLGADVIRQFARPTAHDLGHGATVDVGSRSHAESVHLVASLGRGARGPDPMAEIWLHNGTERDQAGIELHSSDLTAHDGTTLPAGAVEFRPTNIDLPARSSRGVVVAVAVGDTPPATYRGIILATNLPEVWLPLEVQVDPLAAAPS